MVASPSSTSFFGTRLMMGFGGLHTEPPLLVSVLTGFWTWGQSLSLKCRSLLIRGTLILTLIALGGTGNYDLSSGMTHCHTINPLLLYLAPSGMDIIYDQGVPHAVWISLWLVAIWLLLQPYKLLIDELIPHCATEFCCKLLHSSEMISPVSPYSQIIDSRQKLHSY